MVYSQSSHAKQLSLIVIVVSGSVMVLPSVGEPAARSAIQLPMLPPQSLLSSSALQPYRTFAPLQSMT